MPKKYIDLPVKKYLNDIASRVPTPGGGSAAALTSSAGIALLSMAANFTLNKKGYEKYETELKNNISELTAAGKKMAELIDEDVGAYNRLSSALKSKAGGKGLQKAVRGALSVPAEIFEISVGMLRIADSLSATANKNLLCDVACGTVLLRAGMESAKFNIDVNLCLMDDAGFRKKAGKRYAAMFKAASVKSEKIIKKLRVKI